jgi:hypothetical protein
VKQPQEHLSRVELDLLYLGDLNERRAKVANEHTESCASCREEYDLLERAGRHFITVVHPRGAAKLLSLKHHLPPLELQAGLSRRRYPPRTGISLLVRIWAAIAGGLVLTGVALLALHHSGRMVSPLTDIRQKGGPSFRIFGTRAGRVFPVVSGAHLAPGDRIQFIADPTGFAYLTIASIDALERATVYFPRQGELDGRIEPRQVFQSTFSIALDQTLGPERIFAMFSARPIDLNCVSRALREIGRHGSVGIRASARLAISAEFQESVLIEK